MRKKFQHSCGHCLFDTEDVVCFKQSYITHAGTGGGHYEVALMFRGGGSVALALNHSQYREIERALES